MEDFLQEMTEILEEDSVLADAELHSFEAWDSLAVLSVISMANAKYGITLTAQQVSKIKTVSELYELIQSSKR
jgi:acyl carrier protein